MKRYYKFSEETSKSTLETMKNCLGLMIKENNEYITKYEKDIAEWEKILNEELKEYFEETLNLRKDLIYKYAVENVDFIDEIGEIERILKKR